MEAHSCQSSPQVKEPRRSCLQFNFVKLHIIYLTTSTRCDWKIQLNPPHCRHAFILHAALHNNGTTLKHHTLQTFSSENIWFIYYLSSPGMVEPFLPAIKSTVNVLRGRHGGVIPTLYLFLQPGTGQANGFSSPPFMHMELRMDSELMALSVVHDSSLSDSSKSTSSSSHSLPVREGNTVWDQPLDRPASGLWARCNRS